MQEMYKININREMKKEFSGFPPFSCRSPNVDIFMEFLAFDKELNEVAQALDDTVACLLPPPPFNFHHNRTLHKSPYHT